MTKSDNSINIPNYPKYERYKDSGVKWIGEVPEGWEMIKLKNIAQVIVSNIDKHIRPREPSVRLCNYVDVYKNEFITSSIHFMEASASIDQISKFKLCIGDVIITKDSEDFEDIGNPAYVKTEDKNLVCGYHLAILKPNKKASGKFLLRLIQSSIVQRHFTIKARGITRYGLSYGDIKSAICTIPPLPTQTAIAAFLDEKTSLIDKAIAQKERLIELLEERKQIVIQEAVTKGLDPEVEMKDSGVEWIGEVPAHWEIQPIKYSLAGIIDAEHKTAPFVDERDYLVVRTTNVKNGELTLNGAKYTSKLGFDLWTKRGIPQAGDVLLTREAPAGEACIVPSNVNLCLGQRLVWLKIQNDKILSELVVHIIYSDIGKKYIELLSAGSTVAHFNMADIKNIPVVIMPMKEQKEIICYLTQKLSEITKSIKIFTTQITQLKEYRATLIDAAVTGKIKVD